MLGNCYNFLNSYNRNYTDTKALAMSERKTIKKDDN